MADAFSETDPQTNTGLLTDRNVRLAGQVVAVVFAAAVLYLLYRIASLVDLGLLETIFPRFVDAYLLVLFIFVVGGVISVILGVFVGLGRISRSTLTRGVTVGYVEFFRGTPLLFQLIVIYYGIPTLFGGPDFPIQNWEIPAAILGLTLNHGAYIGEAIRGGINSVPDGQMEAARSLGMSYIGAMREVVLPQAWRNALPAMGNDQVILIKDTSLLTVIAVPELLSQFRDVYSTTFDPWTPILLVAVAYLCLTLPLSYVVTYFERRASPGGDNE